MESCPSSSVNASADGNGGEVMKMAQSQIDPFLVEALENPRHRLTVLRMELDIQGFMRYPDRHQFEFQHFPTSYLRCAAHRVAQHYGLQTMVLDITPDGSGRIVVWKTPESRFPDVCLSEIRAKESESCNSEQIKIVLRQRPSKASQNDDGRLGIKDGHVRSVEERKEDYDRARARIFKSSSMNELEATPQVVADGRSLCSSTIKAYEIEYHKNSFEDPEKVAVKDGSSRVAAIFRDREKDRTDPDYDRSYDRYARGMNPSFGLNQYNVVPTPPYMHYKTGFPQFGQIPRAQASVPPHGLPNHIMNPYRPAECNQPFRDAVYMQWPNPALMYAQSYGQFCPASFQVPFYQQPLSFENSQKR